MILCSQQAHWQEGNFGLLSSELIIWAKYFEGSEMLLW